MLSKQLANLMSSNQELEGTLYVGYPIIGTPDGSFPIDSLFVSSPKGLILFNLVEGRALGDRCERQSEVVFVVNQLYLQN